MTFTLNIDNIKYVKVLCSEENNTAIALKGSVKFLSERELIIAIKFDKNLPIKPSQETTLNFICNDGLYKTKTKLKSIEKDEPYLLLILETPQDLSYEQNREFFRVNMVFDCIYSVISHDKMVDYNVKTTDISANGLSIIMAENIISSSEVNLRIKVLDRTIVTKARFIRSENLENNYKISFKYTEISDSDRDFISQICFKKQLEYKRNLLN